MKFVINVHESIICLAIERENLEIIKLLLNSNIIDPNITLNIFKSIRSIVFQNQLINKIHDYII